MTISDSTKVLYAIISNHLFNIDNEYVHFTFGILCKLVFGNSVWTKNVAFAVIKFQIFVVFDFIKQRIHYQVSMNFAGIFPTLSNYAFDEDVNILRFIQNRKLIQIRWQGD